jgi:hypothetical protein
MPRCGPGDNFALGLRSTPSLPAGLDFYSAFLQAGGCRVPHVDGERRSFGLEGSRFGKTAASRQRCLFRRARCAEE